MEHADVLRVMEQWLGESATPDEVLFSAGGRSYSLRQVVEEVRTCTPLGEELADRWMKLYRELKDGAGVFYPRQGV